LGVTTRPRTIRIGIDIGGTFTDLQILDEASGALYSLKTPTTPDDPSIGLMTGIVEAADRFGFGLDEIGFLLHGTTIATNAVLERKLPRGALVTTAGFEDVIEIGRHNRRDVYGLRPSPPPVLIPRDRRLGIAERVTASGAVEQALAAPAIAALIDRLAALEVETVAIALINAFVNPAHEIRLRDAIAASLPDLPVALSCEISPEIREYERSSTTVLNALLMPVVRSYLRRLTERLRHESFAPRLLLVQSNGGVCSAEIAGEQPVRLLLSGPSGGALAALRTAEALAMPELVGIDMGGTSFDVSVVQDGKVSLVTQGEVDHLPVRLPMIEIRTIGAGGGSIAAVDAGGRLTVGPRSAGARPGPVCYGNGGSEPTVTDANLVLGRLDPDYFLGGAMALDLAAARDAIAGRIAAPLGLSLEAAAAGLLTVTNTSLAAAIRLSLFEKGLDPREFALLSFGGAGGLHATAVAEELGIVRVIFPRDAGTFSAYGILHSDIVHDFAQSRILPAGPESLAEVAEICAALRAQGMRQCERDGIAAGDRVFALAADMRYRGQAFELLVPWGNVAVDAASLGDLLARFHALHAQRFSYANPGDAVEIVTLRLTVTGRLAQPRGGASAGPANAKIAQHRAAFLDGAWHEIPVYHRDALAATISGPALIEEPYTTVLLGTGWTATIESGDNLVARRGAAR
jgi:N-methylhydantoinase A